MHIQRYIPLVFVILGSIPGCLFSVLKPECSPFIIAFFAGLAIFLVSFILIWACDAAQIDIPRSLAIAIVSFVVVLPEYAVDMYFTWMAGQDPTGIYRNYAIANMTGANRLLIGIGWTIVIISYSLIRNKNLELEKDTQTEIIFLLLASLYAYVIFCKDTLSIYDTIVFLGIYVWYIKVISSKRCEDIELYGVVETLSKLSKRYRWLVICSLFLYSGFVIFINAGTFSESLLNISKTWGINEFLLIQWFAPIASESPELIVAVMFVARHQGSLALGSLLSAKLNQWTLLVGMVPLVYAVSSGDISTPMPMSKQQSYEILLTASQSLFALSLVVSLSIGFREAIILFVLFSLQIVSPLYILFIESILGLTHSTERFHIYFSVVYVALSAFVFVTRYQYVLDLKNGFSIQDTCKNI